MGKIKHIKTIMTLLQKSPVVTSRDLNMITKNSSYAKLLVYKLVQAGRLYRIKRGFFSLHDDPDLSVFCFKPSYIGLREALSIHGLWEQETATVIVTIQKVDKKRIEVFGNNVFFYRIKPKYMFGYEMIKVGDFYLPVSDIEKTLIDFVYFNQYLDKEVIREFRKRIDREKLEDYLKAYPALLRKRVLSLLGTHRKQIPPHL